MQPSALRSVLWKEIRSQAAFLVAVVGLCVLLLTSIVLLELGENDPLAFCATALFMAAMYAAGSAGTLFSVEMETGTFGLLRRMPRSEGAVFWGKMLWCVASSVAAAVLLWFIGLAFTATATHGISVDEGLWLWGAIGVGVLEVVVWCTLFSLLMERPLASTGIGIAFASLSAFTGTAIVANLVGVDLERAISSGQLWLASYAGAWWLRLIFVLIVGGVDVALGLRWFDYWTMRATQGDPEIARADDSPTWGDRWSKTANTSGTFTRLVWQHWRQSRRLVLIWLATLAPLWLAALLVACGAIQNGRHWNDDFWWGMMSFFGACVSMVIFAALPFVHDQRKGQYRFLAHHGASPRLVWWSRQVLWGVLYLTLTAVSFVALCIVIGEDPRSAWGETPEEWRQLLIGISVWTFVIAMPYVAGQFASIMMRSGLLAPVVGGALTITWFSWCALLSPGYNESNWEWMSRMSWAVAPLPIALIVASRLHANDWLLERRGWTARLRWLGPPLLTAVAIFTVMPFYRVYSVPYVEDMGFSVAEFEKHRMNPENADVYRELDTVLASRVNQWTDIVAIDRDADSGFAPDDADDTVPERTTKTEWRNLPGYLHAFARMDVETHATTLHCRILTPEGIEHFRDLIERAEALGDDAWRNPDWGWRSHWGVDQSGVSELLHDTATYKAEHGDPEAALELLLLSIHSAQPGRCRLDRAKDVFEVLRNQWIKSENMTPELLDLAMKELAKITPRSYGGETEAKVVFLDRRDYLDGLKPRPHFGGVENETESHERFFFWFPWERIRCERQIRQLTTNELHEVRAAIDTLNHPAGSECLAAEFDSASARLQNRMFVMGFYGLNIWCTSEFLQKFALIEADRQATRLLLAIEKWRMTHDGELPPSLEAMVGVTIDELPHPRLSGTPFQFARDGRVTLTDEQLRRVTYDDGPKSYEAYLSKADAEKEPDAATPFLWVWHGNSKRNIPFHEFYLSSGEKVEAGLLVYPIHSND